MKLVTNPQKIASAIARLFTKPLLRSTINVLKFAVASTKRNAVSAATIVAFRLVEAKAIPYFT